VDAVNNAVGKILKNPAMLERLDRQGVVPRALSPQEFAALLREDYARMGRIVKAAGARIE